MIMRGIRGETVQKSKKKKESKIIRLRNLRGWS